MKFNMPREGDIDKGANGDIMPVDNPAAPAALKTARGTIGQVILQTIGPD